MRKKSVGKSFRKINLASTDDFGPKNDKIRLWVINNGGTFSTELNDAVTHLVCSKKAWKSYPDIVRDARRQHVKVISLDWLEDSLLSSSRRPKPEKEYEWETIKRRQHEKEQAIQIKKDNAIKEAIAKFDEHCIDFEAQMQTSGYHPYTDADGFCYSIILVRTFLLENRLEKLTLKLFESDAIPHTYACYVKYTRKGASGREVLAIPGSSWEVAFDAFRKFFKTKTRKDWNDRLDGKPVPISSDGNADDPFRYEPPQGRHEPRGLVEGKTRLERANEIKPDGDDSVTMIVPTIEISDDDDVGEKSHMDPHACTPPGTSW
ncbi:hypothetical protein GJ744_004969 [Endocarpon pusillum]|uniref:BRCT domain-containing protein n=1 Tax=Endocarpon pusillum TaxID=364733 RepID=A0A8H7A7M0_9EURO|nr:hypothetical protein GJ744_004969 [Endocarpon pusillum]